MSQTTFDRFIRNLGRSLSQPLPGPTAHRRMMTASKIRMQARPDPHTRRGAVLILFYPHEGDIYLPLIQRPAYEGVHSGQIAFPGGRYEPSDKTLIHTALREAEEEIGVRGHDLRVLSPLTELFIPPSNFLVLPVVAHIPYRPRFVPDPREVESVIEVPWRELSKASNVKSTRLQAGPHSFEAPYFSINGHVVWGATAMMLSELLMVTEV